MLCRKKPSKIQVRPRGLGFGGTHRQLWMMLTMGVCSAMLIAACGGTSPAATANVVAFMAFDDETVRLVQTSLDAQQVEGFPTPMGVQGTAPSFSADGSKVTFVGAPVGSDPDADTTIYVSNIDGSESVALVNHQNSAFGPAGERRGLLFPTFSPDGTEIAFTVTARGEHTDSYFIMGVDGSNLRRLAVSPGQSGDPDRVAFSPDGSTIAFSHPSDERHYDLYSADPRGGQPTVLIRTPSVEPLMAAFSPDGQRIVYSVQDFDQQNTNGSGRDTALFVADADGNNVEQITEWGNAGRLDRMFATWSPDSSQIAFSGGFSGEETPSAIFVVNADSSDLHQITPTDSTNGYAYPAWRAEVSE